MRAHNEESTVGPLVGQLRAAGYDVVVIASACSDSTEDVARAAGATVQGCPLGIGQAFRAAFAVSGGEPFVQLDSDLTRLRLDAVAQLADAAAAGRMGRGVFAEPGRASRQLARLAAETGVTLPPVPPQALTTAYTSWPAGFALSVPLERMPDNRGADLFLAVAGWRAGWELDCTDVGARHHTRRDDAHIEVLNASNRAVLEVLAEIG